MTVPPITEIGFVCTFLKLDDLLNLIFDITIIMGVIIKLTIIVKAISNSVYISSPSLNKLYLTLCKICYLSFLMQYLSTINVVFIELKLYD